MKLTLAPGKSLIWPREVTYRAPVPLPGSLLVENVTSPWISTIAPITWGGWDMTRCSVKQVANVVKVTEIQVGQAAVKPCQEYPWDSVFLPSGKRSSEWVQIWASDSYFSLQPCIACVCRKWHTYGRARIIKTYHVNYPWVVLSIPEALQVYRHIYVMETQLEMTVREQQEQTAGRSTRKKASIDRSVGR